MPITLTRPALDKAAARYGRTITYVGKPETHNRNHTGPWRGGRALAIHHTATNASTAVQRRLMLLGYDGLPGPLPQFGVTREAGIDCYSFARSNHLGKVSGRVLRAVIGESYQGRPPAPGADDTDGNAEVFGLEVFHDGRSPITGAQYAAAVDWACIMIDLGATWTELSCAGHKEYTRRKIDPINDMATFRADVAKRRASVRATPVAPPVSAPVTIPKTQVKVQAVLDPDSVDAAILQRMRAGAINPANLRPGFTHEDVYQYKYVLRAAHGPAYRAYLRVKYRAALYSRTYDAMAVEATTAMYRSWAKADASWGRGDLSIPGPAALRRLGFTNVED